MDTPQPDVVSALGLASEALEYVERARGHLYEFHQLMGGADNKFNEAAQQMEAAGLTADSQCLSTKIVGRNVLDGRWTFQIVEEFDDSYYEVVRDFVRGLERDHLDGRRHVFERRLKHERRTPGEPGHEMDPPTRQDAPAEE